MNDSSRAGRGATEAPRADQAVDATSSGVGQIQLPTGCPRTRPGASAAPKIPDANTAAATDGQSAPVFDVSIWSKMSAGSLTVGREAQTAEPRWADGTRRSASALMRLESALPG
jgi:hypothetical protein